MKMVAWVLEEGRATGERLKTSRQKLLEMRDTFIIIMSGGFLSEYRCQSVRLYILNMYLFYVDYGASVVAQMVKIQPAVQDAWVGSLGREDPRKKGMAARSSVLPGESHGQRSLVGYSPWDRRVRHNRATYILTFTFLYLCKTA